MKYSAAHKIIGRDNFLFQQPEYVLFCENAVRVLFLQVLRDKQHQHPLIQLAQSVFRGMDIVDLRQGCPGNRFCQMLMQGFLCIKDSRVKFEDFGAGFRASQLVAGKRSLCEGKLLRQKNGKLSWRPDTPGA